jgi:hypothetical protein
MQTKKLMIATRSDRKTLEVVQQLGRSIEAPVPSLFTFNFQSAWTTGWQAGNALAR